MTEKGNRTYCGFWAFAFEPSNVAWNASECNLSNGIFRAKKLSFSEQIRGIFWNRIGARNSFRVFLSPTTRRMNSALRIPGAGRTFARGAGEIQAALTRLVYGGV
jgi:hypothetical protein